MTMKDSAARYGAVSRFFHWTMAALFGWQFTGMLLKEALGRVPLTGFWVGTHATVGMLLLLLGLARAAWALGQREHRPSYHAGLVGWLARAGHAGLYGFMIVIPALALLRMFGTGRAVQIFGVPVRAATGQRVEWMTAPADMLHGTLAWLFLLLIAGHVAMVFVHRWWWRDDILIRMAGKAAA